MTEQLKLVEAVDEYLDEHSWVIKHLIYEVDDSFQFVMLEIAEDPNIENDVLPSRTSRMKKIIKERAEKMKKEKYNE